MATQANPMNELNSHVIQIVEKFLLLLYINGIVQT